MLDDLTEFKKVITSSYLFFFNFCLNYNLFIKCTLKNARKVKLSSFIRLI